MSRRILAALILAGLAIRLLVALPSLGDAERTLSRPDSPTYLEPARALLATGHYTKSPVDSRPATLRPPGLPVFLAALLGVGGGSIVFVAVVLIGISALTALPIYLAGRTWVGEGASLLAAGLFTLNLTSIANAPLLLSDTLFTFLVAWQLFFFLHFVHRGRSRDALITALLAALATLVRPAGVVWIVAYVILVLALRSVAFRRRILLSSVGVVLFAAILVPWMARNASVGAGFQIHTNLGNTLLNHEAVVVLQHVTGEPSEEIRQRLMEEAETEFAEHPLEYETEASRVAYRVHRARGIFRQHPLLLLRLHIQPLQLLPDAPTFLEDLGVTQTGRGTHDIIQEHGILAGVQHYFQGRMWVLAALAPLLLVVLATYLGGGITLVRWVAKREGYLLLLFASFVLLYLVLPGPIISPRYQLPALPFLTLAAGTGLLTLGRRFRPRSVS